MSIAVPPRLVVSNGSAAAGHAPLSGGQLNVDRGRDVITIRGDHFQFTFDRHRGALSQIRVFSGLAGDAGTVDDSSWDLVPTGMRVGLDWELPVASCEIEETSGRVTLKVRQASEHWQIDSLWEVYPRGYVVCTFEAAAVEDQAPGRALRVALPLREEVVFGRRFEVKNTSDDPSRRQSVRGMSVDFSVDDRPVTHCVDLLLESVTHNINGKPCWRFVDEHGAYRSLGWKLTSGWPYPFPKGFRYRNRWCLSVTAVNHRPNPVRGQRICHWSSLEPSCPGDDTLRELAEYGCSILIMHMPSFKHIAGSEPREPEEMRRTVDRAHELGMKVLFYCQPYLISIQSPEHERFLDSRTECLNVWNDLASSQVCCYEPTGDWDADELCLRTEKAFNYIYQSALDCKERYGFDGLYIDWAWPAQGICSDESHGHGPGCFNFYDYLRMMREWRKAIGPDQLMIGHGGGFLVGSDFVEGFDACLTGEAQEKLDPATIGQQFGLAPTLWTFQRRKQDIFRSDRTIEQLIKQGMTPHVGIGVTGSAIIATPDVAHHPQMMALWQMWRAFPVGRARWYGYLTPGAIELDNDEIVYGLHVTPSGEALLLLANEGGPRCDDAPAIGVNLRLNLDRLGLSPRLRCWRMKGNTYETFRIGEVEPVEYGRLTVPEIGMHEFIGFVLSPDEPPQELVALQEHLEGRPQRLGSLLEAKQKRLGEVDAQLDRYAKLPNASVYFSYRRFMEGRVVE